MLTDKVNIFVERLNDTGMLPKKELSLKENFLKYLKLPILVGIDPSRLLDDISKSLTNPLEQVTYCQEQIDISGT